MKKQISYRKSIICELFLFILTLAGFATAFAQSSSSKADDLFGEGMVNFASGDNKGAIKAWEALAKLTPNDAKVFFNLGEVYYESRKYPKSIKAFQKTLQLDPSFDKAQKELDEAVAAGQKEETAKKEKEERSRAKWAEFGRALSQITAPANQSTGQTTSASSSVDNSRPAAGNRSEVGGAPSEADVKAWVKAYEDEINPVGGVGSPMSISLTFHQIQYGEVRSANEGDRLRHVKSDQLYMVIVDYTVNQKFSDGTYPKNKKWKFEFYVNTEDGWSAFSYGPDQ